MSKLLKLKNYLSLLDAAKRISVMSDGEEVKVADVLQFGENGHLQLSIHLVNGGYGCECTPVNPDDLEYDYMPPMRLGGQPTKIPRGGRIFQQGDTLYQVKTKIVRLEPGIWDLPMIGGERLDVRDLLQQVTGGVALDIVVLDGVFLRSPSGTMFEVQEHFTKHERPKGWEEKPWNDPENFFPSGGCLYKKGDFVVRREAMEDFEQLLAEPEEPNVDKPLGSRERRGLLTAFAVACDFAGLDIDKTSATAVSLVHHAQTKGIQLGKSTLESYLKQVPDALETRTVN